MFIGLPFSPVHEAAEAFVNLMVICQPQDACTDFENLILNNYIKGQFSSEIWIHPIINEITTKTLNGSERFHQGFNSEFYTSNQSVFKVIGVLRNIHINTLARMNQD